MGAGKVPDQVGTVSLSNGCTTASYSWSAPSNGGLSISKYGWQYSTNDGSTWSSETETASTSASIDVNNNTNSYVVRVRAFNSLGWGSYSNKSSASTAWTYESYTDSTSCTNASGCDSCGTKNGTQYRTCYRYVRSGCTTTNGLSCGSYGSCTDLGACSDSWIETFTWGPVTAYDPSYGNINVEFSFYVGAYIFSSYFSCGGGSGLLGPTALYYCSVTGAWRTSGSYVCSYF